MQNVLVEEVGSSRQPVVAEQPSEELHLGWNLCRPNTLTIGIEFSSCSQVPVSRRRKGRIFAILGHDTCIRFSSES